MDTRIEHDALGEVKVPAARLWGAQTERARVHFQIGDATMPWPLLRAMVRIKRAAARVHRELGTLPPEIADAIAEAAGEVLSGRWPNEFPLSPWQSGSGTQSHMNVNEVLANRASELLGGGRGAERRVHPNDHVNKGQSTNDLFPTALHLVALEQLEGPILDALDPLCATLHAHAEAWAGLAKTGRTHLQDATPITLGEEINTWRLQLETARNGLVERARELCRLPLGGTAVGTGIGAPPSFGPLVVRELARETGFALAPAAHPSEMMAAHDGLVAAHGALRRLAVALMKMTGDVALMASGPRCGFGELLLPENEPGSSIMPGKSNPTQAEALTLCCLRVLGNDTCASLAGLQGRFELNVAGPLFGVLFVESTRLLADGMRSFDRHLARAMRPDTARLSEQLGRSLMLVTALVPHIGHDAAALIARHAHENGLDLKTSGEVLGLVTPDDFDTWVDPDRLARPPTMH